MLMHRGRLITEAAEPNHALVQSRIDEIAHPTFTPAYVAGRSKFSTVRFASTLAYFQLRGLGMKLISHLRRDTLRSHYLDAQSSLGHKARWRDMRIVRMIDADWRERIADIPRDRLVSFGLQLIPEAAIDYWIEDLRLVAHEDMLVEAARQLTGAGYTLLVKDHPLQFGFRQTELLDRLKALPNVLMVPYEVSGNELLALCGANLTATGTLGLQCALAGDASIIGEAYYATPDDFIVLRRWEDIANLPETLGAFRPSSELRATQNRDCRAPPSWQLRRRFLFVSGLRSQRSQSSRNEFRTGARRATTYSWASRRKLARAQPATGWRTLAGFTASLTLDFHFNAINNYFSRHSLILRDPSGNRSERR